MTLDSGLSVAYRRCDVVMTAKTESSPQGSVAIPVFTTHGGELDATRAYDAVLRSWPIHCDDVTVGTSFGDTHVIAGGPAEGPPVVLLHALFATATSWYRNVEALSSTHRTYCVDVIGEANKSQPTRSGLLDGRLPAVVHRAARWPRNR